MSSEHQPLLDFMRERDAIRIRRETGAAKPWTSDPILQRYKFTNVYRERDRTTEWIRENLREPYEFHPDLWITLAIARWLNHVPILDWLRRHRTALPTHVKPLEFWEPRFLTEALSEYRLEFARNGTPPQMYTGAYMIRAESNPRQPWYSWPKHRYIAEVVVGKVWERRHAWGGVPSTMEDTTRWLASQYGWGPFMAYEVACDLRHTPDLRAAPDIMTWANPGPGARRGLNRLFGRPLRTQVKEQQAVEEMRTLLREIGPEWDTEGLIDGTFPFSRPPLEMREIEHSLCEFDKHERVRLGEGRPRSTYPGAD